MLGLGNDGKIAAWIPSKPKSALEAGVEVSLAEVLGAPNHPCYWSEFVIQTTDRLTPAPDACKMKWLLTNVVQPVVHASPSRPVPGKSSPKSQLP